MNVARFSRWLLVLACLGCALPGGAAENSEAFLDTPGKWGGKDVESIDDLAAAAAEWSGKRVEMAPGLEGCLGKKISGGLTMLTSGRKDMSYPLRLHLDHICRFRGIIWHYDSEKGVLMLDFPWRRPVNRSPADLLGEIVRLPLPAKSTLDAARQSDTWWTAFDSLLSSSQNLPKAGELRVRGDATRMMPGAGDPLLVSRYRGAKGSERVLVVIGYPMQISPGEGFASYYIFDTAGTFLAGGLVGTGWRCSDVRVEIEGDGKLAVIGYHNGKMPVRQNYAIGESGLIFQGGSEGGGYHLGKFLYRTPPKEAAPGS